VNDTERADLAAAIAKHLPGLKVLPRGESGDGSPWVMWLDDGPLAMIGHASFMVDRRYGPGVWGASGLMRFNVEPSPSPDAILAAVRAHFEAALATARADVAAYERALGGEP
jgi:hypothetical protein